MLPLRGGKGRQWEGGIREPFHVRYPAVVQAGSTCDVPVSGIDYYPTLLELAGIPVPAEQVVDGKSLVGLLKGESDPGLESRDLYWHYPHYGNQGGDPSAIIRSGPWKLIHYFEDDHDELYNLVDDEKELHDVSADHPDKTAELRQRLGQWLVDVDAKLPLPDPQHDPAAEAAYLHGLEHEAMPQLEKEHATFLDPDWQPNEDWWGSAVTRD
jgi:arylsulfatase A-like enzyme